MLRKQKKSTSYESENFENMAVKTLTLRQWWSSLDGFKMFPDKFKEKSLTASSH